MSTASSLSSLSLVSLDPSSASSSASSILTPSYASIHKANGSLQSSSARSRALSRSLSIQCKRSSKSSPKSSSSSFFSSKSYLTVHDLYMRYAPLSSLTKSTTSRKPVRCHYGFNPSEAPSKASSKALPKKDFPKEQLLKKQSHKRQLQSKQPSTKSSPKSLLLLLYRCKLC